MIVLFLLLLHRNHINHFYIMRKILLLIMMLFCICTTYAQETQKDVTTFLGIPIDGYKPQMIQKLKSKGFVLVEGMDALKGEFNGIDVNVFVATNNNKVYRIMLCDANSRSESNIKIRFNQLVSQFENNPRYITHSNFSIPGNERISHEMLIKKKTYDAIFYQKATTEDGNSFKKPVWFRIIEESYDKYYIAMFYDNEYNQANGEDL